MRWIAVLLVLLASPVHAGTVKLRVGTLAIDGSRYMQDILALSKEIQRRSGDTIRLTWVTGGQLGDDQAMASQVAEGKLDGGGFSEAGLIALVPEMSVWRYPGLFQTYEQVDRATEALDKTVRDQFAGKELTFLMWADLGFSHLFSTEPVANLRELLQKASPQLTQPLDGKLTEAIATGKARGWSVPPLYQLVIGATKARFMSSLRYRYVVGGLVLSKGAWAKLSAAQQTIVLDVCREWQPKIRASWRAETERGIATLAKAGVGTYPSSDAETTAFVTASATSRDAHAKQTGVGELTARIVAAASR